MFRKIAWYGRCLRFIGENGGQPQNGNCLEKEIYELDGLDRLGEIIPAILKI